MGSKSITNEGGVEDKTFLDSFIEAFNSSINDEIKNLTNTAKDLLAGEIKKISIDLISNTGVGRAISFLNDYNEFSKAVDEYNTIVSSDESDFDKISDLANLGLVLLRDELLLVTFDETVKYIAKVGVKTIGKEIVKSLKNPYILTGLALAGTVYFVPKIMEKFEENPNFNMDIYKYMMANKNPGLNFDFLDSNYITSFNKLYGISEEKSANEISTDFKQYIEGKLNDPIWEMKIPLGEKSENKFHTEEIVTGFDENMLLNKNASIWNKKILLDVKSENKFFTEEIVTGFDENMLLSKNASIWKKKFLDEKSENNFLPDRDVAGFDEAIRLNKDPHIWVIKIPSIPSDNFVSDENDNSEDVFDGEDFEQIKKMIGEGSVLNHYTIAPNLSFSGSNVTQSLDIKLIMAQLEKAIKKEIETTPEGVYRK